MFLGTGCERRGSNHIAAGGVAYVGTAERDQACGGITPGTKSATPSSVTRMMLTDRVFAGPLGGSMSISLLGFSYACFLCWTFIRPVPQEPERVTDDRVPHPSRFFAKGGIAEYAGKGPGGRAVVSHPITCGRAKDNRLYQ
jgi:hypothetical protein